MTKSSIRNFRNHGLQLLTYLEHKYEQNLWRDWSQATIKTFILSYFIQFLNAHCEKQLHQTRHFARLAWSTDVKMSTNTTDLIIWRCMTSCFHCQFTFTTKRKEQIGSAVSLISTQLLLKMIVWSWTYSKPIVSQSQPILASRYAGSSRSTFFDVKNLCGI